ncbi:MAG: ATP-binding cassette domain-containing protein [Cyanobacteria bacterium J06641_5]
MPAILVDRLGKSYPVANKDPGFAGTLKHFFRRRYHLIPAVRDISLTIEPGEVVGFLGPNGAGKTTTLKMLTGLIHPSSGTLRVADAIPFQRRNSFLRKIGLVMGQKQQLIWDLPAIDTLRINAAVYQIPEADFQARIAEFTELLSLEGKLTQPVRKLSLGERMKAELMAALLHQPEVLFLDEPTLGLDVNAQQAVREFLRTYNQRHGATILLTSHYMADITALCPRVILMHEGQIFYDGSLDGLRDRFAPSREIKLELLQVVPAEKLQSFGEVTHLDGREVRYVVRREDLQSTISQLLNHLEILDLTVTDPPIEDVIGQLFAQGNATVNPQGEPTNGSQ